MERIVMEDMPDDGTSKAILYFQNCTKGMVLNPTNRMLLEAKLGEDADVSQVAGMYVEVYVDPTVMFKDRRVGGLRLRWPATAVRPAALAAADMKVLSPEPAVDLDAPPPVEIGPPQVDLDRPFDPADNEPPF